MSHFVGVDVDNDDDDFLQYMGFASFTVLIWDHIITFDREVEYIWPAKKNLRALCSFRLCKQCWYSWDQWCTYSSSYVRPWTLILWLKRVRQNRYLTPLGFIVNLFGTSWHFWTSAFYWLLFSLFIPCVDTRGGQYSLLPNTPYNWQPK